MKALLKNTGVIASILVAIFMLSTTNVNAQNRKKKGKKEKVAHRYKTQDGSQFLKMTHNGDSWTCYVKGSKSQKWVMATLTKANNKKGFYKGKSHATGAWFDMHIVGKVVTLTARQKGKKTTTYKYYKY